MSLSNTSIKFIEYMLGFFVLLVLGVVDIVKIFFIHSINNPIYIIISLFALFVLSYSEEKYPLNINRINIYNVIKISLVYWISINLIFWVALLILGRGFY